jgi:hypothetical protein
MTQTRNDNEHIRAAVELVAAKARKQLERLAARPGVADAEIDEFQRIERLATDAWRDLNNQEHATNA